MSFFWTRVSLLTVVDLKVCNDIAIVLQTTACARRAVTRTRSRASSTTSAGLNSVLRTQGVTEKRVIGWSKRCQTFNKICSETRRLAVPSLVDAFKVWCDISLRLLHIFAESDGKIISKVWVSIWRSYGTFLTHSSRWPVFLQHGVVVRNCCL